MTPSTPRVRAFIETSGSVAEVCLLVQPEPGVDVPWRWDLPYPLWASWGTARTARWLADQFFRHDISLTRAVGAEAVRHALLRALEVHRRFFKVTWLSNVA
ncbi:hypothetical protein [Solirubrum puertoriconensis]|uniref:hypothetical protein n=1 Tax=Solirubrum puertoriconensis TaxID=1751427 RepID=UPI00122E60F9|nr:hypothetical protein [Solirubrum puertoriconensis]